MTTPTDPGALALQQPVVSGRGRYGQQLGCPDLVRPYSGVPLTLSHGSASGGNKRRRLLRTGSTDNSASTSWQNEE
jgi:hypothetical protein